MSLVPFPSPPTDNLYKFVALSGVAIFFLGVAVQATKLSELNAKTAQLTRESLALNAEYSTGKEATARTKEAMQNLLEAAQRARAEATDAGLTLLPSAQVTLIRDEYLRIDSAYNALERRREDQDKQDAQVSATRKELASLLEEFQLIRLLVVGLLGMGGVIAAGGFRLWYTKVQVHLDRQLAKAAEAEEEGAPTPQPKAAPAAPKPEAPAPP